MNADPKWRRRKTARPGEIEAAALEIFAERGFAAARLEEIAERAGLSKAALYVYYPNKTELFRAVVGTRAAPDIDGIARILETADVPFAELARAMLARMAETLGRPGVRSLARMVIAEGRNFPEIARLWHDDVVARALTAMTTAIARAQARGEVRPGTPRLMALSLIGPMMLGALWIEVMQPAGGEPLDLAALAAEHFDTVAAGLLTPPLERAA
ncbi:TetR family transcriptional regulator [Caulobacter sp. KR2-114]|uniref:TetR family transcriptional regulator n=1 Tax=Caulobacter sp. KR2-114 TaxID=3400912 RepID=UPI003C0A51DE